MVKGKGEEGKPPHLVWVYAGRLEKEINAVTWLEMTRCLRTMGWRVTLVAQGKRGRFSLSGVQIKTLPAPDIFFIRQLVFHLQLVFLVLRQWREIDFLLFDRASALWLFPLQFIRVLLGSATPKLVLDTRSALMGDLQNAGWRERLRRWHAAYVARVANNWADGQTAATRRMAKVVEISPARMWGVWPAGVDLVKFQTARGARLWPRDVEALRLIYTGFLDHDRNLVALCQAVEQVNAEGMHFHLTMIGKGSAWNRLDQLAQASRGSIELYEEISHEKIPGRLAQVHVGVIPYPDVDRFQVASPLKLFEYMASGLPVLATRLASHTDVLGTGPDVFWGGDGRAEHLAAALREVWARRSDLDIIGARMVVLAGKHTWHNSAMQLSHALLAHLRREFSLKERAVR